MNRCLSRSMQLASPPFEEESFLFVEDTVTLSRDEYVALTRQSSQSNHWKEQAIDWENKANALQLQHAEVCMQRNSLAVQVSTLEAQVSSLKTRLSKWKTLHQSDCELREKLWKIIKSLRAEIEEKKGIIRSQKQQLFGKKSEKGVSQSEAHHNALEPAKKRSRGQQKGSRGHGRTENKDLPVHDEVIPLSQTGCEKCGEEYSQLADEESTVMEIDVKGYKRCIKRHKFVKTCSCPGSKIIMAPKAAKLLAKNPYGISIWESLLRQKFLLAQPINRILNHLKCLGVQISPGSVAGGFKKLASLFKPLYKAFYDQQMKEGQFHNDESPWKVFEQIKDKAGNRFYLWLTRSKDVVFFAIDPTRSASVPLKHFSKLILKEVIVICDRYSSYFKLARLNLCIILAFCWVHVRRDFLKIANSYPELANWGLEWVHEIGNVYHLNKERLSEWKPELPLSQQSSLFNEKQQALETALTQMKSRCDLLFEADEKAKKEKVGERLQGVQRTALWSMRRCWKGLTVFLEHPETPMDNNAAERSIRNPVIGRKNYYGSGSLWSADLAAMMFTIFQTILLWKINPRTYLTLYLEACAQNNGKPPENVDEFLPWKMSDTRLDQLRKPLVKITV